MDPYRFTHNDTPPREPSSPYGPEVVGDPFHGPYRAAPGRVDPGDDRIRLLILAVGRLRFGAIVCFASMFGIPLMLIGLLLLVPAMLATPFFALLVSPRQEGIHADERVGRLRGAGLVLAGLSGFMLVGGFFVNEFSAWFVTCVLSWMAAAGCMWRHCILLDLPKQARQWCIVTIGLGLFLLLTLAPLIGMYLVSMQGPAAAFTWSAVVLLYAFAMFAVVAVVANSTQKALKQRASLAFAFAVAPPAMDAVPSRQPSDNTTS